MAMLSQKKILLHNCLSQRRFITVRFLQSVHKPVKCTLQTTADIFFSRRHCALLPVDRKSVHDVFYDSTEKNLVVEFVFARNSAFFLTRDLRTSVPKKLAQRISLHFPLYFSVYVLCINIYTFYII